MHIRGKALATVLVAGGLLATSLGAGSASAAEPVRVVGTLGRVVTSYTSGSAAWTASAQAEVIGTPTKGEPRGLRGRAAVKETRNVRRVRIYDVALQQRQGTSWVTVASEPDDVVDEHATAYAVAVTPERRYCWDQEETRSYRVVQHHAVRRSDNVVPSNRTVVSKTFTAPYLDNDPACPPGAFNATMFGPAEGFVDDPMTVRFEANWVGVNGQPIQNVGVTVNFPDGLTVEPIDLDGLEPLEVTDDPNDYAADFAEWPAAVGIENQVEASWSVTATQPGTYGAIASVGPLGGANVVRTVTDHWEVTVSPGF